MTRIPLYVRHEGPPIGPALLEGDVADFQDIGGVYGDQSAAANNVTVLNAFLANEDRPMVRFGGPRNPTYQNARVPGRAYFNGTIIVPAGKPILIDGGGSRLSFFTISGTTPGIQVEEGNASMNRVLSNFDLDTSGSGVRLVAPGRGTVLRDISMRHPTDINNPCTGTGTVNLTDFSDALTAAFGVKIEDSDGVYIENVSILHPGDYGFLITGRLQAGVIIGRVWKSDNASGLKGENLNGVQLNMNAESCYDRGVWLERCGMGMWDSGGTSIQNERTNAWEVWTEANKGRGNTVSAFQVRQNKIEKCGAYVLGGYSGWGSNKIEIDEVSRNCGVIMQDVHVEQSLAPMYNLNDENPLSPTLTLPDQSSDARNNNFATAWPTGEVGVTLTGTQGSTEILFSFPANSLNQITGAVAYWRPWGLLSNFTPMVGDGYIYEMEISGDANAVQWCLDNDSVNSTIIAPTIAPYPTAGVTQFGIFNAQRRKILGRVTLGATGTNLWATPAFTWDLNLNANTNPMTLTIHSLKFYGIRAAGGKIPQS